MQHADARLRQTVRLFGVALLAAGWVAAVPYLLALPAGDPLPAGVCATLKAERAKYPTPPGHANVGALLNATAWTHRGIGLGLGRKSSGTFCPSPAGNITCDYLIRQSDLEGWDVLVDADGAATVNCGVTGVTVTNRPWVAPVNPGTGPGPEPPPDCPSCPTCPTCPPVSPHPVSAEQYQALLVAVKGLQDRVTALEQKPPPCTVQSVSTSRELLHSHQVQTCK